MTGVNPPAKAQERDPICLVLSAMVLIALYLAMGISASHGNQPEGGTPGDIGKGIEELFYGILTYFVGFGFAVASLVRGEGYRRGLVVIVVLYILPWVLIPMLSILGVK